MITSESIQTTEANDIFDPLYQIQIPEKELNDLFSPSLSPEQRVNDFGAVTKRITHWLETAHMIAFSIEQSVKRGDMESYSVEPLQLACNKMHPLIPLLTECIDEQEELEHCRLPVTKIQSEWSGLQHFISFVKTLIEEANEKHMLRTMMENILIQVDDLSMMIFQFQEKRHSDPEKKEDSILLDIDNRVGPLFTNVEKVYTRMTSSNPPEDTTGLLTRKHLLVQERWESLRIEIDELKIELKEDRWLVVFRQVADQVDDMMNGLDKTVTQCYTMIHQIRDGHGMVTSSSSTTSSSSNHTSSTSSTTTNTTTDARTKLRSVEKNFEAKYKYYTPSITKMLLMLGNGIAARVSRNVATLQRHEAMLARWNTLKSTMDQLRKRDLPDIVVVEPTLSDNTHCWSRLSDRSDSTTGSSNWKDLISSTTPTSTSRFLHNKPSSPSLHFEDDRSKSPFKFNHHSPSPLFMEDKVRQYRGTSPNGKRTTSPSFYARESFNSVGSALRPQSISPSHSREDDMISTKDFRSQNNNSRQQTSATSRSITPSIRRSGTPSMIPRPKTPTSNALRPRSSMARITNMTRSESPFRSTSSTTAAAAATSPATAYRPDPKDPLDKQVALIVNRSPIPIQCSKKAGTADGRYYFGNELTPSLGGGKKIYTCKLMTYENSGRNKVLIRVGGGWQDLEIFLLEHMNLIG
ncbi:hypothetical protein FB192DRAFT_1455477 [Mucor lusitanicus]|uniref:GAR domain-containing protein n=2 Tax=Mucor circinelloides f. lusitanicus TaxID=29924 RepID=A0A162TIK1_MUCCL|nr:hypothetical protein FB192DRAFT_1455477 [Mucor lusitanicus]OAD04852.1 hypothetical protein MUCCIDRAFT_108685 [Mucor lusitanicus CBS 277.49]